MKWFWKNTKVIALTGNNAFSVKKLLSVDDLTTNYRAYFNAKDCCLKVSTQNLKNYNDTFGYEVGDHYIVDAAHLIREACGQAGSCCQIGGDEFLVA